MDERITLTDIARHLGCARPTAYEIVKAVDFPPLGIDRRWDRDAVILWLNKNRLPSGARVVGGLVVKTEA